MNASDIDWLLRELRCDKIRQSGDHVYATCPFARWRHKSGRDEHPSFAVAIDNTNVSGARCHTGSCGFSGPLISLVFEYRDLSGHNVDDLLDFVRANNGGTITSAAERIRKRRAAEAVRGDLSAPTEAEKKMKVYDWDREVAGLKGVQVDWIAKLDGADDLPVHDDSVLNKYTTNFPSGVREYLMGSGPSEYGAKRRLTAEMIKTWGLCWDSSQHKIIFPIRDCKQRLVGYSQRSFVPKEKESGPKYMHTKGFRRDFYVYGEHLWTPGGTGCIVEGFFDAQRLHYYGYKPGAVMGTHLSEFQLEKLVRNFEYLVIVPDGDEAGYEAADRWYRQCRDRLPTRVAKTPEGMDPDDFTKDFAARTIGAP